MKRSLLVALAATLLSSSLLPMETAATAAQASCDEVFVKPLTAAKVVDRGSLADRLNAAKGLAKAHGPSLAEAADDSSLYLDSCAAPYYVEPAVAQAPASGEPVVASAPLDQTFLLHSLPGAQKTIYLDFDGTVLTDSAWNESYGNPLTAAPFSTDANPAFSAAELQTVQTVWASVAADYEAFGVDVTTQAPPPSALAKDSPFDQVYGITSVITQGGPIATTCSCGGIAYIGITQGSASNLSYYGTAWVFSDNVAQDAGYIAEAASHELGHNLGLSHDGFNGSTYFSGANPWAPIMGAGYGRAITQWSKGEYGGATNTEDDLAIIQSSFPAKRDNMPNSPSVAAPALASGSSLTGDITPGDVDYIRFNGSNATSIAVNPLAYHTNLDVKIALTRLDGSVVSVVDPVSTQVNAAQANGMNAVLNLNLPPTPEIYYLRIEGAGRGGSGSAGDYPYSPYGSIGTFSVGLTTDAPPLPPQAPLGFTGETLTMSSGVAYSRQLTATGGDGFYRWEALSALPAGLTLSPAGLISGTPPTVGNSVASIRVFSNEATSAQAVTSNFTFQVAKSATPYTVLKYRTGAVLPRARVGKAYKAVIQVQGGKPGYSFKRIRSKLPRGLQLVTTDTSNGQGPRAILRGKAKKPGTYRFTYAVKDGNNNTVKRAFKLVVRR